MKIDDVGKENLPNVYIDSITVRKDDINAGFVDIKVLCLMKDHAGSKSWYQRPELLGLKTKLLLVHDAIDPTAYSDLSRAFNAGATSLYNITETEGDEYFMVIGNPNSWYFIRPDDEPELIFYYNMFTFKNIPDNVQNVNLYIACYLDNLGFENDLFNKYYGPVSSETIFKNGELSTRSSYFYFPDTLEEYGGPVHFHNTGFMEGSMHSDQPHRALIRVEEDNAKIAFVIGAASDPTSPFDDSSLVGGGGASFGADVAARRAVDVLGDIGPRGVDMLASEAELQRTQVEGTQRSALGTFRDEQGRTRSQVEGTETITRGRFTEQQGVQSPSGVTANETVESTNRRGEPLAGPRFRSTRTRRGGY